MYNNGINNPFIMSNMGYGPVMGGNLMRSVPMANNPMIGGTPMVQAPRSGGLLSSLFRGKSIGASGTLKSFNFGTLLNNTSKALGVVRDAIPIVKEVGPMFGNMKQMLKIASIFKDETDVHITNNDKNDNKSLTTNDNIISNANENDTRIASTIIKRSDNEPNFFL